MMLIRKNSIKQRSEKKPSYEESSDQMNYSVDEIKIWSSVEG